MYYFVHCIYIMIVFERVEKESVGGGGGGGFPPKFSIRGGKYKSLEGTLHLFHFIFFFANLGLKGLPDLLKNKLDCPWFATFYTLSLFILYNK
jgi:hypothetical protein